MKELEIHGVTSPMAGLKNGTASRNTSFRTTMNASEAKKTLRAALKADGYRHIEMDAVVC